MMCHCCTTTTTNNNNNNSKLGDVAVMPHGMPLHYQIRPYDVINGRGKKSAQNIGNRRFNTTVAIFRSNYANATNRKEKSLIIHKIIQCIRESGGHFLKKRDLSSSSQQDEWMEIGDDAAYEKVSHALRDMTLSLKVNSSVATTSSMPRSKSSTAKKALKTAAAAASSTTTTPPMVRSTSLDSNHDHQHDHGHFHHRHGATTPTTTPSRPVSPSESSTPSQSSSSSSSSTSSSSVVTFRHAGKKQHSIGRVAAPAAPESQTRSSPDSVSSFATTKMMHHQQQQQDTMKQLQLAQLLLSLSQTNDTTTTIIPSLR